MEEILIALLQFLGEFILNVLAEIPFDWPSRHRTRPEPASLWLPCTLWFLGGCALAVISLWLFPSTLIQMSALRILNLALAPWVSAAIAVAIATHRAETNPHIMPRNHFWYAFWFTLGLTAIRFIYADR